MRFLLATAIVFSAATVLWAAPARAAVDARVKIGHCVSQGIEMSILAEPGQVLADDGAFSIVSSQVSKTSGLNLMTMAIYRAADQSWDIPNWTPRKLTAADCKMSATSPPFMSSPGDPPQDVIMYLQQYVVFFDPRNYPDIDIDELIRKCEAIPVRVHASCRTRDISLGAIGCEEIRLLDQKIEVDSRCTPQTGPPSQPAPAPAPAPTGTGVVRISSGLCSSLERLESSGAFVEVDGRLLVLTSAGAIVSDMNTNSCTAATDADGRTYELKLVRHDWSMNLASLEPPQGTRVTALKLRASTKVDPMLTVKVNGQDMAVLSESSSRHFVPRLGVAMELQGALLDASSVGLPAIDSSGDLAAILTDSHLKMFPGSLTRPQRWMKGDRGDHVIAISAGIVAKWLASYPPVGERLWALPDSQFRPPLKVKAGHLVIEENCPPLDTSKPHADYPIGGADAVGIGGDSTGYRACSIRLSLDSRGSDSFFASRLQPWHDQTKAALARGTNVEIPFFLSSGNPVTRSYLYSTMHFFALSDDSVAKPIGVLTAPDGTIGSDASLAPLRTVGVELAKSARGVYAAFQSGDPRIGNLIRRCFFLGTLAQSENWTDLQVAELEAFVDPKGSDAGPWAQIESFAVGGKRLKKNILDLLAEMKRLKP